MPSLVPRMVFAAAPPSSTSTLGDKQLDLAGEERRAGLDLLRRRRAISRRPPIDRVGDVDVLLGEPDRGEHAVEQLPGAADKGLALQILVAARRLADHHDAGLLAASGEAEALGRPLQRAAVESGDELLQLGKRRDFGADPARRACACGSWCCARRRCGPSRLGRRAGRGLEVRRRQSSRPAPRRSPRRRPWPDTSRAGPAPPFRPPPASSRPLLPQLPRYPRCVGYWIPAYAGMT